MDLFRNDPNFYPFGSDGCGISSGTLLVDIIIVGKEFGEVFHREVFSLNLFPEESSRSILGNDCIEINLGNSLPNDHMLLADGPEHESIDNSHKKTLL